MPPEETIPESIIRELNDTKVLSFNSDEKFLTAPSEVYSALSKNASCAPSMENEDVAPADEDDSEQNADDVAPGTSSASFQRKIVKDQELKDDGISLIVVASLVDKPNNLGGICRTSEIFRVDTLVVADVLVAQDSNFKALSMSSENWQKIEGVKLTNLLPYFQNLRPDGRELFNERNLVFKRGECGGVGSAVASTQGVTVLCSIQASVSLASDAALVDVEVGPSLQLSEKDADDYNNLLLPLFTKEFYIKRENLRFLRVGVKIPSIVLNHAFADESAIGKSQFLTGFFFISN